MSKKLSFILLISVTLLFIIAVSIALIYRITIATGSGMSVYDQLVAGNDATITEPTHIVGKINLNTATYDDLVQLPGIGNVLAERILEYRKTHGNFTVIDELLNISGIGTAKFDKIKDYISVGG